MSKCRIQYFRLPVPVMYSATKQILLNVFVRFIIGRTHKEISILFCLAHSGRCEFNVLVQEHQPEFWRRPTFVNAALITQQINCPLHLWQSLLLQYYCLSHEAKPPGLGTELKGCGSLLATFKDALFLITRLVC